MSPGWTPMTVNGYGKVVVPKSAVAMLTPASAVDADPLASVIVDPIAAFLGEADSHKNSDIRTLIAGLARIAAEHRFSVLIVSHLNKGSGNKPVYRVMGSLAFVAAARPKQARDTAHQLALPAEWRRDAKPSCNCRHSRSTAGETDFNRFNCICRLSPNPSVAMSSIPFAA